MTTFPAADPATEIDAPEPPAAVQAEIAAAQADLARLDAALQGGNAAPEDLDEAVALKLGQARLAQLGYENTRQRLLTLAQDIANVPNGLVDDAHIYCQTMIRRATIDTDVPRATLDQLDVERRVYEAIASFQSNLTAIYQSAQARSQIA